MSSNSDPSGLGHPFWSIEAPDFTVFDPLTGLISSVGNGIQMPDLSGGYSYPTPKVVELEEQLAKSRASIRDHVERLKLLTEGSQTKERQLEDLRNAYADLKNQQELAFLLKSVTPEAHEILLTGGMLRDQFFNERETTAFVVSADIRRSTELMLKAKTPALFAGFMTLLWNELEKIFKANYGVVDKFTGDGILAFFPEFFSGDHAGFYALRASFQAQQAFQRIYDGMRSSFTCVLKDSGIGAGVDYGPVHLLRMAGALTVVGQPVVYACRMGGAPAGHTYLNQSAYDKVAMTSGHPIHFSEVEIDVKHEGTLVCYSASQRPSDFSPQRPHWCAPVINKVDQSSSH